MKSIFKQTKMIIIIIGFIGICSSCSSSLFAGIFYPKVAFGFDDLEEQPPYAADVRLSLGAKYPQVFAIFFGQEGNSFKKDFISTIFVNKPYKKLHIKEMSYTWQEGEGVFFVDNVYQFDEWNASANGWHWNRGFGYSANFEKIFKNKKPGDTFWFTLKIVFSLDDEPEQTEILKYNVVTYKNEYVSIISRMIP